MCNQPVLNVVSVSVAAIDSSGFQKSGDLGGLWFQPVLPSGSFFSLLLLLLSLSSVAVAVNEDEDDEDDDTEDTGDERRERVDEVDDDPK